MLIVGRVYAGSRLVRMEGPKKNLLLWYNTWSEKYGVHLYEKSPEDGDEDFLIFNYRNDKLKLRKSLKQ